MSSNKNTEGNGIRWWNVFSFLVAIAMTGATLALVVWGWMKGAAYFQVSTLNILGLAWIATVVFLVVRFGIDYDHDINAQIDVTKRIAKERDDALYGHGRAERMLNSTEEALREHQAELRKVATTLAATLLELADRTRQETQHQVPSIERRVRRIFFPVSMPATTVAVLAGNLKLEAIDDRTVVDKLVDAQKAGILPDGRIITTESTELDEDGDVCVDERDGGAREYGWSKPDERFDPGTSFYFYAPQTA